MLPICSLCIARHCEGHFDKRYVEYSDVSDNIMEAYVKHQISLVNQHLSIELSVKFEERLSILLVKRFV